MTLNSYYKLSHGKKSELDEISRFLHLGKRHKSCSQVLVAVADFLDSMYGYEYSSQCGFTFPYLDLSFNSD